MAGSFGGPPLTNQQQNQANTNWNAQQGAMGGLGAALGTNSQLQLSGPNMGAYAYQGANGGAIQTQQQYQQAGQLAQTRQGAQIQNGQDARDQAATQGVLGQEGALGGYYQGVLNGTAPSLAQAQMNAATNQSIQAQMAMANSARGTLGNAAAQMGAQQAGVNMQQNAAQQAMIGRIQEEQNAAQGYNQLLGQQGNLALGEQGYNQQAAYQQAQLQQQQNSLNDQMTMGYAGLGQQAAIAQLNANEAGQNAALTAQQQALGQSEFNAGQNTQMLGAVAKGVSSMAAADLKFREPGGGSGFTLREEPGFLLLRNDRTGDLGKIATQPLTPAEHRQAMAPHGAGPLGATLPVKDPRTGNLFASDLHVEDTRPQLSHAMGYR